MSKGQPRTGNGRTSGNTPKAQDCAQRLANGVRMIKQPDPKWARKPQVPGRRHSAFGWIGPRDQ